MEHWIPLLTAIIHFFILPIITFTKAARFDVQKHLVILRDRAGMHGVQAYQVQPLERLAYAVLSVEERRKDIPPVQGG